MVYNNKDWNCERLETQTSVICIKYRGHVVESISYENENENKNENENENENKNENEYYLEHGKRCCQLYKWINNEWRLVIEYDMPYYFYDEYRYKLIKVTKNGCMKIIGDDGDSFIDYCGKCIYVYNCGRWKKGLDIKDEISQWNSNSNKLENIEIDIKDLDHGDQIYYNSEKEKFNLGSYFDEDKTTIFFDDFISSDLNLNWLNTVLGSNSDINIIDGIGGQIMVTSGETDGSYAILNINKKNFSIEYLSELKIRFKLVDILNSKVYLGLIDDDKKNSLDFILHSENNNNKSWYIRSMKQGISTYMNTNIQPDTNWHILKIITKTDGVHYYLDEKLVGSAKMNLPTDLLGIYLKQKTDITDINQTPGTKNLICDFVKTFSDRDGNSRNSSQESSFGCTIL